MIYQASLSAGGLGAAPGQDEGHEECRVIEGFFAIFVQGFLALTVLGVLIFKRYRENPQRTLTIWFMDCSKQGFAMGLQHGVNILLALLFASQGAKAGQCIWYIANFSITVFCGLFLLSGYMALHRFIVERYGLTWLRSGEYGDPPRWAIWFTQMLLWCFVCCSEKLITASLVIWPLYKFIDTVLVPVEKPILNYPRVELVLVMVLMPMLLNALFAWIVDNLIKDPHLEHKDP
mmetsp:Transcript_125309/g.390114  ORF Transcript_125309/g.390114 Transcript_125309/m.390114 type:complete len:233 (-) Transcript_125309:84-782(-)|eukprot:CAMPEP_0204565716 /NCGR_PEP_ID=MMETSP0661-20131031/35633_1 /ASSEMBLY_ACC=CAM_ASM_000606 /TAXON_ID=109239 /ORGANISM="Alexandrium margalefi, Strain AMGDE01CS-322" /LENGTH=232 /DNA_ID=CAMNT_0051573493 /DNA_START=75 /DNA_END=773 /DNA_ORIENTATION=+